MGDANQADELARYRAYFESSSSGLFVYDAQGRLVDINPAACRMHGHSREAMLAMDPREFIAPESHHVFEAFRETLSRGERFRGEAQGLRSDGGRFDVEVEGRRIEVGEDVFDLASLIDVTGRKVLVEQPQHAQRMDGIGRLAGGIAHDFNNLLSVILGCADLLTLEVSSEDARWQVDSIVGAGERARDLVRQLLAFSRRQPLRLESLDLCAFARAQRETLRRVLPERVRLRVEASSERVTVGVDRLQLEQVVLNLAINAWHAMPEGGELVLEVRGAEGGEQAGLEVRDTGSGIAPELQAKIFEPFFTTKERDEGTGLGLAMVYGIVERHGGRIELRSEVGAGASFTVWLPVAAGEGRVEERVMPEPVVGGGEAVLVVEDEDALRGLITKTLRDVGYHVIPAVDAGDAEEVAGRLTRLDAVISDLRLPSGDGRALCAALRGRFPRLGVVLMSGYAVEGEGLPPGAAVLSKPFRLGALAEELRGVLDAPHPA